MSHTYDHGGNIYDCARQLGIEPSDIADFSASINPLGISLKVKKAIICALDNLIHYPDCSHSELKHALANYHGLPSSSLVIANGSTELIYHLPAMLHGKRALIISPSFSEYVRALGQQHWEAHHFILSPDNNFLLDLPALEQALAQGYDALYLCNPANPGGSLYPQHIIEQVYSLCIASGTFLVLDEAFMDFCEEASAKRFIVKGDNAIILRSMTKFFGIPGLRLGYSISSATLAERLDAMGGPWSVNSLALAAGVAALLDTEHNQQTLDYIQQERRLLFDRLSAFRQFKPHLSCTNYILVEIIDGISAPELQSRLLHQRVMIRDCSSFMGPSPSFLRIAVRTVEENKRLLEALTNVMK